MILLPLTGQFLGEVKKETGIDAKFESLVCLRHWHGYRYGKSDIYFVCRLSALSTEITMDQAELAECLWMPLEDFLADTKVHSFNKLVVRAATSTGGRKKSVPGFSEKCISEYKSETYELLSTC
ncbi:hypothetical protein FACS189491_01650 [Spirochaetia bacterium]|nr:hypothetical protein FACS189491_01650 [Spirochaetia bacterium]